MNHAQNTSDENYSRKIRSEKDTAELKTSLNFVAKTVKS